MKHACIALVAGIGVFAGATKTSAHHSAAMFDTTAEVTVAGTITRYDWKNPHVYMAIETEMPDGTRVEQEIEAGASSVLLPLGLTADSIAIGDHVTVHGNPSRSGAGQLVLGRELIKDDGTTLPLNIGSRSIRAAAAAHATSIAGTWFAPLAGFGAFNGSRRTWQLTDKAEAALAAYDGTTQSAHASCIPVTAPMLMAYPVIMSVEVSEATVVIDIDWMASRRVVYLDGRGHPESGERSLHGHSIGHWEADTLVVDTTQFAAHREGLAFGIPSGAQKHLVERFSLNADGMHVDYEAWLEDPEHLVAPVTHRSQWEYRPELTPTGLPCDLDVAQRFLRAE